MPMFYDQTWQHRSPPTRGAWIEISVGALLYAQEAVAPHTGGVD